MTSERGGRLVTITGWADLGVCFIGLGGWLTILGGTVYYLVAGIGLLASGTLVVRRRRAGLHLYAPVLDGKTIWTLWEAGLDGWALIPRVVIAAGGHGGLRSRNGDSVVAFALPRGTR